MSQWSPDWNKEESFDDFAERTVQEKQNEKKRLEESKKKARAFYQCPILIVSDPDLDTESEYFLGVLNENRNKIDPALPAPSHTTLKNFKKNREEYERKGTHIVFLGKSREADTLFKAKNKTWDYDNIGLHYATLGNKTIIGIRALKNKEIDRLIALANEIGKNHSVVAPDDVETVRWSFLKESVLENWETTKVATILTMVVAAPLVVVGQALEGTVNGIQAISNLSAKKQLEYVQYCLAILKYLESENALVE